jgi:hypothetical protein
MKIIPHPLALNTKTEWRVQKNWKRKHRRNWRVVKVTVTEPGCWVAGGVMYMHPTLFAKMKEQP